MQIIRGIPKHELLPLQKLLDEETKGRRGGILDIWSNINPLYIGVKVGDEVAGVATLSCGEETSELYKLYVAPAYRGREVSTLLLAEAWNVCKELDNDEIFVQSTPESFDFWNHFRSSQPHEPYGDGGLLFFLKPQNVEA